MVPEETSDPTSSTAPKRRAGLTQERALWTIAILTALIAGLVPRIQRMRISSNETAAIGTLRTLSTSEAGFQSSAIVDVDGDGSGEFGFLIELAGTSRYRTDSRNGAQGFANFPTSPAFLTSRLGTTAKANNGVAIKSGYYFLVYLPTGSGPAMPETGKEIKGNPADADSQEVRFACYAWPVALGKTGRRAFVVTQQGEVFAAENQGLQNYSGLEQRPSADAALFGATDEDPKNLEGQLVSGRWAADGFVWVPARN